MAFEDCSICGRRQSRAKADRNVDTKSIANTNALVGSREATCSAMYKADTKPLAQRFCLRKRTSRSPKFAMFLLLIMSKVSLAVCHSAKFVQSMI